MALVQFVDISVAVLALACLNLLRRWHTRRYGLPRLPGPKGLPLIGNTLEMQGGEEWKVAKEWGEKYGPVVYVKLLGTKVIFLNSYQVAVDLLEKRGWNYSSRPTSVMSDLEGWTEIVPVSMPYGEELKKSRQMLHRFLQPTAVGEYSELQTRATHKVLEGLLRTPDGYFGLIRHWASEMIMMMTYGHQISEKGDYFVELAKKGDAFFAEAQRVSLVDSFPWLQYLPSWFPGAGFKKIAEEGHQHAMAMFKAPHEMVKRNMRLGTAIPSMSSRLMDANTCDDGMIANEDLIAKTTCVTYGAGADTTVSIMQTFLLAMVLYPDVQKRAQEELDRIVGKNNLPSFNDRPHLPYIDAICKECLRWQPNLPLALPHTVTEDDEYNGYHIPAGATVFANVWAITRDPKVYDDPEEFVPERWLSEKGKEPPLDIYNISFGFGRRICPGRHFADNSIFIGIASILSAFSISKALDENKEPITPDVEYTALFLRHPKPFKYSIRARSTKMDTVIRQAAEPDK